MCYTLLHMGLQTSKDTLWMKIYRLRILVHHCYCYLALDRCSVLSVRYLTSDCQADSNTCSLTETVVNESLRHFDLPIYSKISFSKSDKWINVYDKIVHGKYLSALIL